MLGTRHRKTAEVPTRRCRMCGTTVALDTEGRCSLGHQVMDPGKMTRWQAEEHEAPGGPSVPAQQPHHSEAEGPVHQAPPQPDPRQPHAPAHEPGRSIPHRPAVQVTRGPAQTTPPAPAVRAPSSARAAVAAHNGVPTRPAPGAQPAPEARQPSQEPAPQAPLPAPPAQQPVEHVAPQSPQTSTFAHPYDEVLRWGQQPAPSTPQQATPAGGPPIDDALDALLALHDEPPPPAPAAPLSAPVPPLPAPPMPAPQAVAPSALDVFPEQLPAPPPAYAPTAPPRHEFVDEAAEDAEDEAGALRRRVVTLVAGALVAMAAGFGAAFVLPVS